MDNNTAGNCIKAFLSDDSGLEILKQLGCENKRVKHIWLVQAGDGRL